MHLGKAKHANAGVTKLLALKMVLLDKAAHASRRLTRTFRDATWPFPARSADSTISILSKMRCLAYATALSVGPGTALGTGFMPGCSWRGQQKFSTALCTALSMYGSCNATMTDLQPSTGPKGHHQAHMPFALTHRHSDSTSFYSRGLSLIASHRHHSMGSEAVLRPDCRICLEVDDGVRKALHKDSNSSVEGAPSSRRSFATVTSGPLPNTCLRNNFRFCWCAMRRPCRKIFAILGLSPSVMRMCANESAWACNARKLCT